jgi:hypothetical protein
MIVREPVFACVPAAQSRRARLAARRSTAARWPQCHRFVVATGRHKFAACESSLPAAGAEPTCATAKTPAAALGADTGRRRPSRMTPQSARFLVCDSRSRHRDPTVRRFEGCRSARGEDSPRTSGDLGAGKAHRIRYGKCRFAGERLVRLERFELPTFGSVVRTWALSAVVGRC